MKVKMLFIVIYTILVSSCISTISTTKAKVSTRLVEQVIRGEGSTTIVLETGMGPTIDTWNSIFDSLTILTKVYAYNRPGNGNSNIHNPPLHIQDVSRQLRENLRQAGLSPPYLLVGHSAGGLYVNMFARMYPDEVKGVIFLDASHPEQFEYFKQDQQLLYQMLVTATTKGNRRYEHNLVKNTFSDFQSAPAFPSIPISVLTAGKKSSPLENHRLKQKWLMFQDELASLSSASNHLLVEGSGHYIHKDRPEVVISEIKRILAIK